MTTEGPLLILAGAGSGKTTVLTKRIAWILANDLAKRSQILAVTFTNKAAAEMIERIGNMCGKGYFANAGTFHSVCARWLRREAKYLDVSAKFSIYDTRAQLTLIKEILKDRNLDPDKNPPKDILAFISRCKNDRRSPEDLSELLERERFMRPIYQAYNERLRANDSLDFDDLLLYTVNLFASNEEVREKYRSHLRYIMVDEFQDVNPIQYELLRYLIGPEENFCSVGDDDQSIYGFRGADISIILRFEQDFPGAKVVKLEQNYRSTQQILDVANRVVGHNVGRKDKKLWSNKTDGLSPCVYVAKDGRHEARFVIDLCKKLVEQGGYSYSDIAILYRTNMQSRSFEEVLLREEGIGYEIVGGHRFYDRKEVRDVLAYLKILANSGDSVALSRIVACTPGIGEGTYNKIMAFAAHNGVPVMHAMAFAEKAGVSAKLAAKCRSLFDWLDALSGYALSAECKLHTLLEEIIRKSLYRENFLSGGEEEDEERRDNIDELLQVVKEFDRRSSVQAQLGRPADEVPLYAFLNEAALLSDQDELNKKTGDNLVLMTIHTSKGLEFPIVFLVGVTEGLLPHSRSKDLPEAVEEERRLCYVGLTRAKDMLYITSALKRGDSFGFDFRNDEVQRLSRFMYEMPVESLDIRSDIDALSCREADVLRSGRPFNETEEALTAIAGSKRAAKPPQKSKSLSSTLKTSERRRLLLQYPVGRTVRHPDHGVGVVSFLANGKVWVRFSENPKEVYSFAPGSDLTAAD